MGKHPKEVCGTCVWYQACQRQYEVTKETRCKMPGHYIKDTTVAARKGLKRGDVSLQPHLKKEE